MKRVARLREVWRGVFGPYEVSNLGRVRNASRNRLLKPGKEGGGYLYVVLYSMGSPKNYKVHSLVAAAFIGPRPLRYDVNHLDGDKANNRAANLEYVSRADNLRHAFALGLKTHAGTYNPRCRYTEAQVQEVRSYLQQGCLQRDVSSFMGVPMHFVADISAGRNWLHVQ